MRRIYITFDEAAHRADATSFAIQKACDAGHMKMYLLGEPNRARLLRVVAEDDFDGWVAQRKPRGPKKREAT